MNEPKKTSIEPSTNSIRNGIEHEPGGGKALINPADTVLLLLDHQSGLFQVVKDIEDECGTNKLARAIHPQRTKRRGEYDAPSK